MFEKETNEQTLVHIPFCFQIKATENNDDTRIGVAEVNIKLKDINDEFPVFEKESFTFTVDEHAAIGTYLGSVKANDRDASDNIT